MITICVMYSYFLDMLHSLTHAFIMSMHSNYITYRVWFWATQHAQVLTLILRDLSCHQLMILTSCSRQKPTGWPVTNLLFHLLSSLNMCIIYVYQIQLSYFFFHIQYTFVSVHIQRLLHIVLYLCDTQVINILLLYHNMLLF